MNKKILRAENLVKKYRGRKVVDGVTLEIAGSSIVGLLGPNGAGKTTTFYMIAGLIGSDEGKVTLNGEEITDMPMHERALKGITYLPQEPSAFRKLTVEENIKIVFEAMGLSRNDMNEKTQELLEDMGLFHLAKNRAESLSGGERRRLEVIRALATDPDFILLDEPFAGVDPLAIADLQGIIKELKNKGIGVFISDHNVRETLTVCDSAYIVNNGRILEEGTSEQIASSDLARKIYLGEHFKL